MASSVLRKLEKKNTSELKNETVICAQRRTIEILSSLSSISFRCPPPKILYWENLRPWSCQIYIAPKNGSWHSHTPPLNNTACWTYYVFADFLQYLFQCSSEHVHVAHANGEDLWASVKDHIHFVLSHPNGWDGMTWWLMMHDGADSNAVRRSESWPCRIP